MGDTGRATLSITVHSQGSAAVKVELPCDATVAALKASIFLSTRVSPDSQALICRGRVLGDDDSVEACHGHAVHMLVAGR